MSPITDLGWVTSESMNYSSLYLAGRLTFLPDLVVIGVLTTGTDGGAKFSVGGVTTV